MVQDSAELVGGGLALMMFGLSDVTPQQRPIHGLEDQAIRN